MNELIEFLHARLAKDERIALGVSEGPRKPETWVHQESRYGRFPRNWIVDNPRGSVVVDGAHKNDAVHIARHDPDRVLRAVAAKRAQLDLHRTNSNTLDRWARCGHCNDSNGESRPWPCPTVRALASEWNNHPDYRKEWAP